MNAKNDDGTKSGEKKPKPTCESGPMADIRTMREMAAVNLKAAVEYGAALDEIRLFFDEDSRLEDPVESLRRMVRDLEKIDTQLKAVGK